MGRGDFIVRLAGAAKPSSGAEQRSRAAELSSQSRGARGTGKEPAVKGPQSLESVIMAVKLLLLMTLFYMSGTSPDLRTTSTIQKNFRSTQENGEARPDNPTSPSTSADNDPDSEKLATPPNDDDNPQHSKASTDHSHSTPTTMQRKATRGKHKVHRMVGWLVGTGLTLASILVLIAAVGLNSRGTNTTNTEQEEAQNNKNCCCRMLGWMTRTSSQLPLWKSLLLKSAVTILSTIGAAVFSLVITNLLAEREESVEDTVRDILGLPEQGDDLSQGRRRREADRLSHVDPTHVHWLAVLFICWLTSIPLLCYIIASKCTDTVAAETVRSREEDRRKATQYRRRREQKTEEEALGSAPTSPWPTPPSSMYSLRIATPPPAFCELGHPPTHISNQTSTSTSSSSSNPTSSTNSNSTSATTYTSPADTTTTWFTRIQNSLKPTRQAEPDVELTTFQGQREMMERKESSKFYTLNPIYEVPDNISG